MVPEVPASESRAETETRKMSESHQVSKLKRKKSSVEELRTETSSRETALFSRDGSAKTDGCVLPAAAAWWNRHRPPAVESLWVLALKSELPYLERQLWEPLPDLPTPSPQKPKALKLDDQLWGDLCGEVPPFPEPASLLPPSPKTSSSSDPPSLSFVQPDPKVRPKPAPSPPDRCSSSHSRQSTDQPVLSRGQQPPPRWREEAAASSSEGRSSVGGGLEGDTGSGNGPVLAQQLGVSERSGPPGEEEEVRKSAPADGGAELRSCPMCLQEFPAGFSQMDCDSHLAQCLSEMNVDMTW